MAEQTPPRPDFEDPVWNTRREQLENELIARAQKLREHTGSFKLSVKGTYPALFLACGTAEGIRERFTGKPQRTGVPLAKLEKQILTTLRKLIEHTLADTFRFTVEESFPPVFLVCGTAEEIQNHIADELPRDS
jgi:hypothetical protein